MKIFVLVLFRLHISLPFVHLMDNSVKTMLILTAVLEEAILQMLGKTNSFFN